MAYNIIKHRRGTTEEWLEVNLVPEDGELIIEECSDGTRKCKIGDGRRPFTVLPYIDEGTQAKLLQELSKLEQELTTKVTTAENSFVEQLAKAELRLSDAVSSITTEMENKTSLLDKKLVNAVTELTQQSKENSSEVLTQLEGLAEKVKMLNEADSLLLNRIFTLNNEQTNTVNQLATDIETLATSHATSYSNIILEIANLEESYKVANLTLNDSLIVYITKIYAELADLVDDDVTILRKLFEFKAELDTNLVTATQALEENIENLRSNINVKFIETQKSIDNLDLLVQNTIDDTANKFIKIEDKVLKNNVDLLSKLSDLNDKIDLNSAEITNTNKELALQTKRINNIVALPEGTTVATAELEDIRIGYNGLEHACAGDAVRAIGNDLEDLKASLPDYIPSNAVDGLLYEDNLLYLTSSGVPVSDPILITGGSGGGSGSMSIVKVKNNLTSNTLTISKGTEAWIDFTYTSFENEIPTGDGTFVLSINGKKNELLSGSVQHNVAKRINITDYLKTGVNDITVTCTDQFGTTRSLYYKVSVIELRIESSFDSSRIFNNNITFRYKIFGKIEKTIHVYVDDNEISNKKLSASVSGSETTLTIPKLAHGSHNITAYISAIVDGTEVLSNVISYEIICIEETEEDAILVATCDTKEITNGDLVSIPYMLYDPATVNSTVELIISTQVAGEIIELERTQVVVDRSQQFWNTRKYPNGIVIFTINYNYTLYGVAKTLSKSYTIKVNKLDLNISAEEDGLQLFLSAQGRSNNEKNPAVWTFKQTDDEVEPITTSFSDFNWKSNGWLVDEKGDTCLRLNGEARATINLKPFAEDFKSKGKTIEFEFLVRDVNSREAIVIDCFDGLRGFRATPDTAFLKSSGTNISCRYKDEEKIRVAVTVEHADSLSRFVSIYLDGVLSGVQRYSTTDNFAQDKPISITLGSSLCGLDIYSIRIYDKALTTSQILNNYIADKTDPTTKLQLVTDNEILDEEGKISYNRVKALGQIPIITFTGQMPTYKGDKKKKSVRMKFEDPVHPEMNFDVLLDQIDVQGTSSQFYARKNWKVNLPEARPHMPGAIPAKVYCIKVDYAEATGTHNTGTANYVETLYDRTEVTLPPQKDDTRVRTTIQGFPVIMFEKETEDSEPIFSSKGNFNYDKGAENAFGFTEDYNSYGVECWEFCNNTADSVNFVGEISANWLEDFEPRYVPKSANFERIEELQELAELAASGKATMTEGQRRELSVLMENCIANFKEMHDWVLSTATYSLVDGKRIPITAKPLANAVTYGDTTYTEDNEDYRLAKFRYEFENYFNLHYTSIYYVFTLFALMTDQRAKNLFLTRWKDDDGKFRWYPYFYDNDTIFGINNEGALVFDYYHEDIDQVGSSNVYNGQNSAFWNNFRICFPQHIQETYAALRSNKKLSYDTLIDQYITSGSDKWNATIYNEDAEYKYISMARQTTENGDVDASNLYQVRGSGEQHLRYFIDNRLNYCDSKWYAGDYPDDYIFLRIYTPTLTAITDDMSEEQKAEAEASNARIQSSLAAVPADPSITVTPFSNMYAGVRYKSGSLQQQRLVAGEPYKFTPVDANETFGDTETAIYGASELSSLGDLSGLYCGVISLGKASKLVELKMGNADPAYHNDNFREISVGSNRLLRTIDLRNCSGLGIAGKSPQKTLDLSGCPNIEHIYTEGTNLETINLPESGYIKTLHLPASINTLVLKNQQHISDFSIESYDNLKTLCLENCPTLNTDEILASCKQSDGKYSVERVRLTGINWHFDDAEFIKNLIPKFDEQGNIISGIRGIDEKNNNLDDAYLVGTCYIEKITGADYTEIKKHYPYLDINFGEMTSNVIFKYTDNVNNEYIHTVSLISYNSTFAKCDEPVLSPAPAWPENDAFSYEHTGWSRKQQISKGINDNESDYLVFIQADALTSIAGDRTLYPVFKAVRKNYEVNFVNPTSKNNSLLQTISVPYGSDAIYTEATPTKQDSVDPGLYAFTGWYPAPEKVTGPLTCYAQFTILDDKWYTIGINDITNCTDYADNLFDGYILNKLDNTMSITECNNNFNSAVKIPYAFTFENTEFVVKSLGGFSDHINLELITLPDSLNEILARGFYNCYNLYEINLPNNLQIIGKNALQGCSRLKEILIPASVIRIDEASLADCTNLTSIKVDSANLNYKVIQDCLIDTKSNKLIQGLATSVIPQDGTVTSLGQYCFSSMNIPSVIIPEGILEIPNNAFSRCGSLESVTLPSTLRSLDATCFAWCSKLKNIELPAGLLSIRTYVFDSCAFESVTIPSSIETILERAFGDMSSLKTVTFEKNLDKEGNIKIPYIHYNAFANSGTKDNPVEFNLPWSEQQHKEYFEGTVENNGETFEKDPAFGANYYIFNFDYKEG